MTRPMTNGTAQVPSADQTDAAYAESLGIVGDGSDALAALRAVPAETLVEGLDLPALVGEAFRCPVLQLANPEVAASCVPVYHGIPMIDGTIILGESGDVIRNGGATKVPLIIGTTAADMPLTFPPNVQDPYSYFGADSEIARAHYSLPPEEMQALVAAGHPEQVVLLPLLSMGADMTMHESARFVAKEMTAAEVPVWLYRFTYVAESERPSTTGQGHAGELPFLFQTTDARYGDATTDIDRQAAQQFNQYIANFVINGDPNGEGLPEWPVFDPANFDLLNFTFDDGPVFETDPRSVGVEQ